MQELMRPPVVPSVRKMSAGCIEVICGSMFSGKTEELIRRLRRASLGRMKVQAFKPALDDRYDQTCIVSHDDRTLEAHVVGDASGILDLLEPSTEVVGIDEAQFFDECLPEICEAMADQGLRVIVAGLDQDYLGRPFGPMPALLAVAEHVTKTMAVCVECGSPANRTDRIAGGRDRIEIGAQDKYRALCRSCYARARLGRKP